MRYNVNELVVFQYDGSNQVGLITNRRTKKGISTYDIRSEKGSAFLMVPVDSKKSHFFIDSKLTEIFRLNDGKNNMFVDKNLGHTVANYSADIQLTDEYPINHFERNNDFVFKTIGARSY